MSGVMSINFDQPDETRPFPNGQWEIVYIGPSTVARGTFQPGWHWADHVKPIVGTESCQQRHVGYLVQGALRVRTEDGTEVTCRPGEAYVIEPGHDAWAEGNEPTIALEFATRSAETYATKPS
jgi:quercetin dioxygenase-like cupin family protein